MARRKKRTNTNKRKGNKFENDIAKLLSKWIFNDIHVLTRHRTSGAQKHSYVGDLEPQKQLHEYGWPYLPILFELKTGYEQFEPTFNNQNKLKEWLIKSCYEINEFQTIVWLIMRIKNKQTILISSKELDAIHWDLCLAVCHNGVIAKFYSYILKNVMIYSFPEIVKTWEEFDFIRNPVKIKHNPQPALIPNI